MTQANTAIRKHFDSFEECLDYLSRTHPPSPPVWGADGEPDLLPAFLFRGEPRPYRSTVPSIVRTLASASDPAVKDLLIDLEGDFLRDFEEDLGWRAGGFSQHYGLPTDYVEFTASLAVAAFFACSQPNEESGLMGVLDLSRARAHCAIVSLSDERTVSRPVRQQAYAVRQHGRNLCDYKEPRCCERLGLTWYGFNRHPAQLTPFRDMASITDSRTDSIAEWMKVRIQDHRATARAHRPAVQRVLHAMEARLS